MSISVSDSVPRERIRFRWRGDEFIPGKSAAVVTEIVCDGFQKGIKHISRRSSRNPSSL